MKLTLIFCLFISMVYSQPNINLPEIKENNFKSLIVPYHSIYVTKSNMIVFDKDTINLDNLKTRLLENYLNQQYSFSSTSKAHKNVHFFIDKDVKYEFIDKVFTEVSTSLNSPSVILRGNINEKNIYDVIGLKSELPKSFYSFSAPEYLYTNATILEREKQQAENTKMGFPEVPDKSEWHLKSIKIAAFTIQQEIIDEQLQGKRIECIHVSNKGMKINDSIFAFNNETIWDNLIKNMDAVFVTFDNDLTYDNYINYIKSRPANFYIMSSLKTEIIELNNQILSIHKKARIKLCDCLN